MTMTFEEIESRFKDGVHIQILYVLKNYYSKVDESLLRKYHQNLDQVHWRNISKLFSLSESFISDFSDKLYWKELGINQKLSLDFIRKHINQLNLKDISHYQVLDEKFVSDYIDYIDIDGVVKQQMSEDFLHKYHDSFTKKGWRNISEYQKLSEPFIEQYSEFLDWELISKNQKLSEFFIEKNKDKVYWANICRYQYLSKNFIEKFELDVIHHINTIISYQTHLIKDVSFIQKYAHKIDWSLIIDYYVIETDTFDNRKNWCLLTEQEIEEIEIRLGEKGWEYVAMCENLSEPFIEKHLKAHNLKKDITTYNQTLSESFIDKMSAYVDWKSVGSQYHKLSEPFIEKWEDIIDWSLVCEHQQLSIEFMKKFDERIDWEKVSEFQKLSRSFVTKYKKNIDIKKLKNNTAMTMKEIEGLLVTLDVVDVLQ